LILVSAAGVDTAGLGPARSWALWQGTLVVIEMLLVGWYAAAVSSIDPRSHSASPAGAGTVSDPVNNAPG